MTASFLSSMKPETANSNYSCDKSVISTNQFFTFPFRRRRKRYTINPPDDMYHVVYLGNVFTVIAKGEECVEKPLSLIWRTYCSRKRAEIPMKLFVTRSGLKVETSQQGITEYWSHRITYCVAPTALSRVFCWVYKHEGKRMKPELRCHAVLCKKPSDSCQIAQTLERYLRAALQEYRREKLCRQNARLNALVIGQSSTGPKRKQLLQTGTLNFRPPVSRTRSAPRLFAIDEEDETVEEQQEEYSDIDSICYQESPIGDDACSTNSFESSATTEITFSRQNSIRGSVGSKKILDKLRAGSNVEQKGRPNGSAISSSTDFSAGLDSGPSSIDSNEGATQSSDFENRLWKLHRLRHRFEKQLEMETDAVSEESGYHEFDNDTNGVNSDRDDDNSNELFHDDDESQYDEQVTAL
ncbi:unnamed protein product [Thelazia callipaeda]|uniref:PID domain-containing protein n=1 Tax=Thelazia callipaeda TaxID=103827 RepID=A0A0N5CKN5_THECL|nr:unnamed protein product [Thelazia callipaeda]